jgi:transposase
MNEAINIDIKALPDDTEVLKNLLLKSLLEKEDLSKKIEVIQLQYTNLVNQVLNLRRNQFGQKSESFNPDQGLLFDKLAPKPETDLIKETITYERTKPSKNNRNGRNIIPDDLLRVKIEIDLPVDKKLCPCGCGKELRRIGEEITEQLEVVPAKIYVNQFIRYKYAGCNTIITANMPPQPIDKGLAGPGLLADTVISKYQDHMPLYRQEQKLERHGIQLARSTLCDWVQQTAELLAPIVSVMRHDLLKKPKIHSDDTSILLQQQDQMKKMKKMKKTKTKKKTKKTYLWVYIGAGTGPPVVVYDYTPTRGRTGPTEFLKGYKGYVQADAYSGYDELFRNNKLIIEVGCMAHCRRKFYDVYKNFKSTQAEEALLFIQKLYKIEKDIKELKDDKKQQCRKKQAKPLLDQFKQWLDGYANKVAPKSPLGLAIQYALNQWAALNTYLEAGYLDIDNNAAERLIKPIVLGRKNWLQLGSPRGGKNAAVLFSLIETCKLNEVNTFDYLRDVLQRLPTTKMKDIRELLPYCWKASTSQPASDLLSK